MDINTREQIKSMTTQTKKNIHFLIVIAIIVILTAMFWKCTKWYLWVLSGAGYLLMGFYVKAGVEKLHDLGYFDNN